MIVYVNDTEIEQLDRKLFPQSRYWEYYLSFPLKGKSEDLFVFQVPSFHSFLRNSCPFLLLSTLTPYVVFSSVNMILHFTHSLVEEIECPFHLVSGYSEYLYLYLNHCVKILHIFLYILLYMSSYYVLLFYN